VEEEGKTSGDMSFNPTTERLDTLLSGMAAVAKGALKLYYRCIKPYYHSATLTGRVFYATRLRGACDRTKGALGKDR
jgi:hypothetical protein